MPVDCKCSVKVEGGDTSGFFHMAACVTPPFRFVKLAVVRKFHLWPLATPLQFYFPKLTYAVKHARIVVMMTSRGQG